MLQLHAAAKPQKRCSGRSCKGDDLPVLRLRRVIPVFVFGLAVAAVALPSVTNADGPTGVTIHEGADAATWGYTAPSITVAVGQSVTWTNSGALPHDAASTDGSWKTPLLNSGQSASVTFSTAGTYTYICTPHPWMKGTIVVTAAAPAPAPADASAGTASPPAADPSNGAVSPPASAPDTTSTSPSVVDAPAPDDGN